MTLLENVKEIKIYNYFRMEFCGNFHQGAINHFKYRNT